MGESRRDRRRQRDARALRQVSAQLRELLARETARVATDGPAREDGAAAGMPQGQSGEIGEMPLQADMRDREGGLRDEAFEMLVSEQLARITAQLETLGRRLDEERPFAPQRPEEVPGYAELKTALYNLVEHLELAEGRTAEAIGGLRDRLEEVAQRTAQALELAQRKGGVDGESLQALEQRIGTLNERMRRLEEAPPTAIDEEQLTRIIDDEVRNRVQAQTQQTEQRMASLVSRLQEKLEELAGGVMDIDRLRTDVERVETQLQQVDARLRENASAADVQRIENSLKDLSARVAEKVDRADVDALRQRLDEVAERLQQERQAAAPADDARLAALEEQVLQIRALVEQELGESLVVMGERLTAHEERLQALARQPAPAAADEERLQRLEESIATLQQALQERRAGDGEEADAETLAKTRKEVAVLKAGLGDLRKFAQQTDQQTREMLTTVQEALAEVVERLVALEERPAPSAAAPKSAHTEAARPSGEMTAADALLGETAPGQTAAPSPRPATPQPPAGQMQGEKSTANDKDYAAEVAAAIAGLDGAGATASAGAAGEMVDTADRSSAQDGAAADDFIAAARRAAVAAGGGRDADSTAASGASGSLLGRLLRHERSAATNASSVAGAGQAEKATGKGGGLQSLFGAFTRSAGNDDARQRMQAVAGVEIDDADAAPRRAGGSRKRLLLAGLVLLSAAALLLGRQQFAPKPSPQPAAVQQQETTATPSKDTGKAGTDSKRQSQNEATPLPAPASANSTGTRLAATAGSTGTDGVTGTGLFTPRTGTAIHTASLSSIGSAAMPAASATQGKEQGKSTASLPSASATGTLLPDAIGPASLRNAALNGDGKAAYVIALRYLKGEGVPRDVGAGLRWLRQAAEKGVVVAMYRLGAMHERGLGVPRDALKARVWYERAALRGNVRAMHNLAVLLASGKLQGEHAEKAAYWFRKAATHGVRDSQFNLAVLYHGGRGVERSLAEAWFWYSVAAAQGDSAAAEQARKLADYLPPADLARMKKKLAAFTPTPPIRNANVVVIDRPEWRGAPAAGPRRASTASAAAPSAGKSLQGRALVSEVQKLLKHIGYDVGPVDGIMGNRTANAIRLFQMQSRMPVNGTPDMALLQRLRQHVGGA